MTTRRIAVLWNTLTGYMNAVLRPLAARPDVELFVADHMGTGKQAPFADELFSWIDPNQRYRWADSPNAAELLPQLEAFQPDTLLVASWNSPGYRAACKAFEGRAVRVCGMDNQWEGSIKQWVGRLSADWFVQKLFDAAFVTGERQAEFARYLKFNEADIWRGLYCGDVDAFSLSEPRKLGSRRHAFLYAGRLVADKGVDTLIEAYCLYRETAEKCGEQPWLLRLAGNGPGEFNNCEGIEKLGFLQPTDLPGAFAAADCFVLPSRWENWGVVIHEAAAAALPIICTTACGASVHLVWDGYNGLLVGKDNARTLAAALTAISRLSPERYEEMTRASAAMAQQLTPQRWLEYFLGKSGQRLNNL